MRKSVIIRAATNVGFINPDIWVSWQMNIQIIGSATNSVISMVILLLKQEDRCCKHTQGSWVLNRIFCQNCFHKSNGCLSSRLVNKLLVPLHMPMLLHHTTCISLPCLFPRIVKLESPPLAWRTPRLYWYASLSTMTSLTQMNMSSVWFYCTCADTLGPAQTFRWPVLTSDSVIKWILKQIKYVLIAALIIVKYHWLP